jgi:hypothetical protein
VSPPEQKTKHRKSHIQEPVQILNLEQLQHYSKTSDLQDFQFHLFIAGVPSHD